MQVTTIGLDIAKNVFQVHAIDAAEKVVVRKQLRRSQVLRHRSGSTASLFILRTEITLRNSVEMMRLMEPRGSPNATQYMVPMSMARPFGSFPASRAACGSL